MAWMGKMERMVHQIPRKTLEISCNRSKEVTGLMHEPLKTFRQSREAVVGQLLVCLFWEVQKGQWFLWGKVGYSLKTTINLMLVTIRRVNCDCLLVEPKTQLTRQ